MVNITFYLYSNNPKFVKKDLFFELVFLNPMDFLWVLKYLYPKRNNYNTI